MDPKIAKRTQDSLGKIIKKPPLTEKLLSKPPFRFLHDIMTSVIKTTGFMKGLFTDGEMNSENVKDKETKLAFLQKGLDMVCLVTGKALSVKLAKVIAGHEPEKTNEFLQALAHAINKKVDNDDYVKKVLNKGKENENIRDRSKSGDRRKREEKQEINKDKEEQAEREERHHKDERRDRERSREGRNRDDKHRNKDDRHKDRVRDEGRDHRSPKKSRDEGKENESPEMVNGESEHRHREEDVPPAARIPRPASAKGHRRRREGHVSSDEEDEPVLQRTTIHRESEPLGEDDLPPQVAEARKLARPSSARPAPPKRKQEGMENEPAMKLGSGKPTNLIVDDDKSSDEDENFLVEESAPPPSEIDQSSVRQGAEEEGDHGGLVKKILETKKELESGSQQWQTHTKTQIERPHISDAQKRKQREHVQREIDKLRASIQTLTRSANPLGKIMDYVQEDLDSMQKEQEKWKAENKEHTLALKRETSITDQAVEPMKAQLAEIDQAIKDQLDLIAAVKSNIIKNDQKIDKMLRSIARS